MKRSGMALALAGALTLVAHLLYAHFLSGSELARYRVMSGPGRWMDAADGFVGAAADSSALHHAGPFTLEPSMNPLRMVLELRPADDAARTPSTTYGARLVNERGATVWAGSAVRHGQDEGSGTSASSVSMPLDAFEIDDAGRYVLLIDAEEAGAAQLSSGANIILRRNVAQAQPALVAAGVMALALGVALALLAGRAGRRPGAEQSGTE